MKKRLIALLATIIIAIPILAIPVSRAQPRWTLMSTATAICGMESNTYIASVTASPEVYKMDIDVILYEKGLFTSYKEVSSIHKTVYNYHHNTQGSYSYSSLKDYKIELTVTAYTQSGQTETITVANEYT